ncbi:DNA-directed RNA polymerase III subunit RPC5-like isoform X2 [Dreissena polymorpha]|nr:DNA-directed RNA polymerase III subunit RPC5-like isoform X2 [Dreissena polymorpha]
MDEEDPIEQEINVHLTKALADNLYLLQYPVRPSFMTYDSVELLSGKVKPGQSRLELEVALNTSSSHYCKSKGEQFALNVDGKIGEGASFFTSDKMDKQVLTSHPTGAQVGRYAVGYFKGGELFMSPVRAQLQMKPSFSYLDKSDTRAESKQAALEQGDSSQDEAEEEATAVTVKFARPESDAAKARRLASFSHLQRKQEEESWLPLHYYNVYSEESERELTRLLCEVKEASSEFHVESTEYLNMLMSHDSEIKHEKPAMPSNVLSLTQLKSMPLADQVKALLTNAKVIRFSQLLHLLPQGTDPIATLRALQIVAVMVQGCWVVKSEVLYPKDGCSPNSGVSSEFLCRGRDFVMWRFTQSRCVTRKEVASVIKLPNEDVKDILEQMSHIRFNHGWEFVFPHDYEFTDRYPEIVERQAMLWNCKYQTISKQLNITDAQEKKIRELAAAEAQAERPRRRRTSSRSRKRTLSGRSISDHSDMETELTDIELILAQQNKSALKSPDHNKDRLNQHTLNGATMEVSSEPDDAIANGSDHVHSEFQSELEAFIKDRLWSRYVMSMSELTHLLHLKLTEEAPGSPLGTGVTETLCEQAVIKLGGLSLKSKWQTEAIFMHVRCGDTLEPLRHAFVELLKTSYKIKKRHFIKKMETVPGSFTEDDMVNVLKDYCIIKKAHYYLKCCNDYS